MKKYQLLALLITFHFNIAGQGDIINTMLDPSNNLEKLIEPDSISNAEQDGNWDESYRTSDEEGEKGTQYSFDVMHVPEGAVRVGCICMDEVSMDLKGGGACSGHGGVRFWVYKLKDGEDFLFPTERHKTHPSPLSVDELSNLTAYNKTKKNMDIEVSNGRLSWTELMAILAICVTIAYIVKTFWGNKNNLDDEFYI